MTDEKTQHKEYSEPASEPVATSPPARSGRQPRAKAILVLLAVFFLGALSGGAVGRITGLREIGRMMAGPPPEARARFRLEAMRRHLKLSDAQLDQVKSIFAESDAERDKLMASCGPGLEDLRKRTDDRILELLDEDQKKRFEEMRARHRGHPGRHPRHR